MKPEEFLNKEYDHFVESFWKNEETGERKLNIFIGFTTIIFSSVIAVLTMEPESWSNVFLKSKWIDDIAGFILAGNFLLGIITFVRILWRNRVADAYKEQLAHIRQQMTHITEGKLPTYKIFKGPDKWLFVGGYAETIAAVNSLLLGAIGVIFGENIGVGIILFLFFLIVQLIISYQVRNTKIYSTKTNAEKETP